MIYNIEEFDSALYWIKGIRELSPRNRLEYHKYNMAFIAMEHYIKNVLEKKL